MVFTIQKETLEAMIEQTSDTPILEEFFKATIHSIIADLKNRKLMQGFTTIGLDTSPYEPYLYKVVFLLAGIKTENQNDDLRDWYYTQIEQILEVEITDTQRIDEIASSILLGLMERKKQNKKSPKSQ